MLKLLVAVIVVAVGFSLLPVGTTYSTYTYRCPFSQSELQFNRRMDAIDKRPSGYTATKPPPEVDFSDLIPVDGEAKTYGVSIQKSGLRKAIESRLEWLGLDLDLSAFNISKCPG